MGHSDPVVRDFEGPSFLVGLDLDFPFPCNFGFGEAFESCLVYCVGGIGDKFPKENLLVRIERMNDEMEQFLHLRLEFFYFL